MKNPFRIDVPPRAAAAIIALAAVASVVTGRDERPAAVVEPRERPSTPVSTAPAEDSVAELDLERIARARPQVPTVDLFAPPPPPATPLAVRPPPPPPRAEPLVATPPPAPSAPPLPFRYAGQLADGGRTSIFLVRGNDALSVRIGETIDGRYRVEGLTTNTITFLYVPLGERQTLAIAPPP